MPADFAQDPAAADPTAQADPAAPPISATEQSAATPDANPSADNGEAAAPSSADENQVAKQPESLLDAIKDVLPAVSKTEDSTATDAVGAEKPAAENDDAHADTAPDDAAKAEAEKEPPFHNHPRWKEVTGQLKELRPKAEEFDKIVDYMHRSALTPEEVSRGFEIMAAMKNDPVRAYSMLSGHIEHLKQFTGDALPEDLARKVEDGHIAQEDARELAARRAQDGFAKARTAEIEQRAAHERQLQAQRENTDAMRAAVGAWESGIKTRDPDYEKKQPLIADKIRALVVSQPPANQSEAVALAQRAYAEVTNSLKAFVPRRPAVTTLTSSGSASTAKPAPTSLAEAVRLAAAGK